jgi:DNA-binding CsgD family transcriptional regulator
MTVNGCPPVPQPIGDECALTPYQVAILQWIANGKRDYDIAAIMGNTTEGAIQQHIQRMHSRFGTNTRGGLLAYAMRKGWVK